MKPEKLSDAIGLLDDKIIESAEESRKTKKKNKQWIKWVAVAACFCLVIVGVAGHFGRIPPDNGGFGTNPNVNNNPPVVNFLSHKISEAKYPETVDYPQENMLNLNFESYSKALDEWHEFDEARLGNRLDIKNYSSFLTTSTKIFFKGNKDNLVYSPVNVYLALSMLAETTGNNSRAQILDLLGTDSIESIRNNANKLWLSNYMDDGVTTNILANSVWLNEDMEYNKSTLDILAEKYYASSFKGKMGSNGYNKALQKWLNDQTGGLLKEEALQVEFNDNTILGLASTVYFKARWDSEFNEINTAPDIFNGKNGKQTVDFMNQTSANDYYYDDNYSAVAMCFTNRSAKMWLILPDEDTTPEKLIQSGDVDPILTGSKPKNCKPYALINLAMPKFDVSSTLDLRQNLKQLGVTDVFDDEKADFSPTFNSAAYVSMMQHSARVTVDEEGCTAAAFTVVGVDGMAEPKDIIDFRLDRPFIFVVTADDSTPLFVGIVNNVQ